MTAAVVGVTSAPAPGGSYVEKPFRLAFIISLVAHGLLVLLLPHLRHLPPVERPVLQVDIIEPTRVPPPPPEREAPLRPKMERKLPSQVLQKPAPEPVEQPVQPRELAPLETRDLPQQAPVPEFKAQPRPEPVPASRPEPRPDLRPMPRPDAAVAPRVETRTALTAPAPVPELKTASRPDAPLEVRREPRPEPLPDVQAARPAPLVQAAPVASSSASAPPPAMQGPTLRADAPAPPGSSQPSPLRSGPERARPSGGPTAGGFDRAALEGYALDLSRAIGRSQNYPRRALQLGWQGKVELEVRISQEGKVTSVEVARSSGYPMLDDEAVAMVKRTGQLPSVPTDFRGREFTVLVPVVFKID